MKEEIDRRRTVIVEMLEDPSVSAERKTQLRQLLEELDPNDPQSHGDWVDRAERELLTFEAEHPEGAAALRTLINVLSNAGI